MYASQERIVSRTAKELTRELPLEGTDPERGNRIRYALLAASMDKKVLTEWGEVLPSPEVSLVLLEKLIDLSPKIARLSLRMTVDEEFGCWGVPIPAEHDSRGRARYPNVTDREVHSYSQVTHRYAWRVLVDPNIPTISHLDHLCRVHACCNIGHLQQVTIGENTQRGAQARVILGGQAPLFHPEK